MTLTECLLTGLNHGQTAGGLSCVQIYGVILGEDQLALVGNVLSQFDVQLVDGGIGLVLGAHGDTAAEEHAVGNVAGVGEAAQVGVEGELAVAVLILNGQLLELIELIHGPLLVGNKGVEVRDLSILGDLLVEQDHKGCVVVRGEEVAGGEVQTLVDGHTLSHVGVPPGLLKIHELDLVGVQVPKEAVGREAGGVDGVGDYGLEITGRSGNLIGDGTVVLAGGLLQLGDGDTVGLEDTVVTLEDGIADVVRLGSLVISEDLQSGPLVLITGQEAELLAVEAGVGNIQGLAGLAFCVGIVLGTGRGRVLTLAARGAGSQRADQHESGQQHAEQFFHHEKNLL